MIEIIEKILQTLNEVGPNDKFIVMLATYITICKANGISVEEAVIAVQEEYHNVNIQLILPEKGSIN